MVCRVRTSKIVHVARGCTSQTHSCQGDRHGSTLCDQEIITRITPTGRSQAQGRVGALGDSGCRGGLLSESRALMWGQSVNGAKEQAPLCY